MRFTFPKLIYRHGDKLRIDIERGLENIISIDGTDYVPYYVDKDLKGNKGGNSFVLTLYNAQSFEEDEYNNPAAVLKILKFPIFRYSTAGHERFTSEIFALKQAQEADFNNVIEIYDDGICSIFNPEKKTFEKYLCYIMEFADSDLKTHIETVSADLYYRLDLCLGIANGIKELYSLGYYHRDLKPDNIFIVDKVWKVGDLGLIGYRDSENKLDKKNALLGPRGWYSPEAMNKYLTEGKNTPYKFDCKIDHQSDIFQLGALFWYILQGNSPTGTVKLSDFKINDSELFAVLKTMLNNSKKSRFQHIDEVIKLLKKLYNRYYKIA